MVAELRCFNTSFTIIPDAWCVCVCVCVCVHAPVLADRKYPWHCNFQSNLNWADKCVIGMLPLCCQRYLSVRELICLAHWSSKLKIYSQTLLMFLKLICCVEARFEGLCVYVWMYNRRSTSVSTVVYPSQTPVAMANLQTCHSVLLLAAAQVIWKEFKL